MISQHVKKLSKIGLNQDESREGSKAIKEHEHDIDLCKKLGCRYWEKAFKGQVFNKAKSIPDEFERYAEFINRTLNYHAFKEDDPLRSKYISFLHQKHGPK